MVIAMESVAGFLAFETPTANWKLGESLHRIERGCITCWEDLALRG